MIRRRCGLGDAPEAEVAYQKGLLELCFDDPARARAKIGLVDPRAYTVDHAAEVHAAVDEMLNEIDVPCVADLAANIRRRIENPEDVITYAIDLLAQASEERCAYSLGIDRHAYEVTVAYRRQRTRQAAQDFQAIASDPAASTVEIAAALQAARDAVEAADGRDVGWKETGLDLVDEWSKNESTPMIETGFAPLDGLLGGGLPVGGLVVIGARPGAGKSALAIQATLGALELDPDLRAVYGLGEMTGDAFARRMIARWSNKPGRKAVSMGDAKRRTPQSRKVSADLANKVLGRLAIVRPPLSIERIEAAVVSSKARLLVIDFLQLVEIGGAADRRAEVDGIVRWLRRLTLQHGVATIVITNLAKNVNEETRIGALAKESAEVDYAADLFLLGIPAEVLEVDGRRAVKWFCKKQKDGQTVDLETLFDGRTQTFEDNGTPPFEEFADFAPAEVSR